MKKRDRYAVPARELKPNLTNWVFLRYNLNILSNDLLRVAIRFYCFFDLSISPAIILSRNTDSF